MPKSVQRLVVFQIAALLMFVSGAAHAQTPPPPPPPAGTGSVALATVNIQNARVVSQNGNVFRLSFDLTNRVIPQTGVKYAVMLVGKKDGKQFSAASRVYDEAVTLPEHSSVRKDITYTAPTSLQGSFDLVLTSENANGFPFAIAKVATVELTASGGIEILTDTCYLTIQGDKKGTHYFLRQGVDVSPKEALTLHCEAQNRGGALTATPTYITHYRTTYGEVVPHTGGDTAAVSFAAQEKKTLSLALPKAAEAQAYDVVVTLGESNPVDVHYVLQGDSATIQNLSLDKNYYQKGETATLSFLWSPAADTFIGSRRYSTATSATTTEAAVSAIASSSRGMTAKVTLVTNNTACAESATYPIGGSIVKLPLSITTNCKNPHLSLDILDASGKVLAHEELQLTSDRPLLGASLAALLILLLAAVGVFYFKRHAQA